MLKPDCLDAEVKELVFDFFYRFARFEFSLKENGMIKRGGGTMLRSRIGRLSSKHSATNIKHVMQPGIYFVILPMFSVTEMGTCGIGNRLNFARGDAT
ncbi:hypothetical protein SG18_12725 [Pandoraea apista]|nr:hypothetical protein SG18_12725 [Pandoraea apista]